MIAPNPFGDILIVQFAEGQSFPVDLILSCKAGGKTLHDRIFTTKKIIDVADLPPGFYHYILKQEKEIIAEGHLRKH